MAENSQNYSLENELLWFCFVDKHLCETDYLAPCCCFLHACNVITMVTEKLRQNDETLKEVLEERQSLIAELLHVQPSDVSDKVKVSKSFCLYGPHQAKKYLRACT